jgi:hypothetical protein
MRPPLGEQRLQPRIRTSVDLLAQDAQAVGAPCCEIQNPRPHARRVKNKSHCIDGRSQKRLGAALVKLRKRGIRKHNVPAPVHCEGWKRLVRLQHAIHNLQPTRRFAWDISREVRL